VGHGRDWHSRHRGAPPLTLEVDAYGDVLKLAAIGYGRRFPDQSLSKDDREKQTTTLATFTENTYTNPILDDEAYRTPLLCEARSGDTGV
jgi:hypothetical protein